MSNTEVIPGTITKNNDGGYTFSNFVLLSTNKETREMNEIIMDYVGGELPWIKK